ncbi:MAG: M6 family metalloprotease domain-containing protein [Fibromonadales bacterium]|nr:M6 family metalloprotease domain-containing protein [Fibromonadales bacterium]
MKKALVFAFAALLFIWQQVFAVPAYPGIINYKQPDGSEININLLGDEWVNWAVSLDGYTMLFNKDSFLEYAVHDQFGDLKLSGVRARNVPERTLEEQNFLSGQPKGLKHSSSQIEIKRQFSRIKKNVMRKAPAKSLQRAPENVRIPIILVEFQDKEFTLAKKNFEDLLNGRLVDYFSDNSYGKFNLQVDIFGPYKLANNISHYDDESGGDPNLMAKEAVSLCSADGCVFSDAVHIIFAGHGQEAGAAKGKSIWSHASLIDLNGKKIRYSCSPELRGNSGANITHIGVIAHELGHALLDLPDFYDTDYEKSGGNAVDIGYWCLMANGLWNDVGNTPSYLSAYARGFVGWTPVVTLSQAANIALPSPAEPENIIYRINTAADNEYFLLENRQQIDWDAYVPGSGMLIYYVDENHIGWTNNCINCNPASRGYYVKQAGCDIANGCANGRGTDPWPQTDKTEFADGSVTDIAHDITAKTVSFKFIGGSSETSSSSLDVSSSSSSLDASSSSLDVSSSSLDASSSSSFDISSSSLNISSSSSSIVANTDIMIMVGGETPNRNRNEFAIIAPCGAASIDIDIYQENAEIVIGGLTQEGTYNMNLSNYGDNSISITAIPQGDAPSQEYTLTVNKPAPAEQMVKIRWNNTLTVINNPDINGGYEFANDGIIWYRNGREVGRGQSWSAGADGRKINSADKYYFEAIAENGESLRSCEFSLAAPMQEHGILIKNNSNARVEIEVVAPEMAEVEIAIYDIAGNLVFKLPKNSAVYMPRNISSGLYFAVAKAKGESGKVYRYSAKFVVKK